MQKNGILDGSITILDKTTNLSIQNFAWNIIEWNEYLHNLDKYDYIFKSPWISPYTNWLWIYKNKILTQTKLFYEFYEWKIISITQTKWKSTTATLTYKLLKNAWYSVKLVWNIWNPVLDEIDIFHDIYDFVVYEVSSYMGEDLENHHSFISIFWNLFQDHLDWHLNFENYTNAKKNVLKSATHILMGLSLYNNLKNSIWNIQVSPFGPKWAYYSHIWKEFFIHDEFYILLDPQIPWSHNEDNFSAILWVADIIWIDKNILKKTINHFLGLPHRLENLWTYAGITFIDDAISTTPESTIEGIKAFDHTIGTIFLWWTDRGYNFESLVEVLHQYTIKNIVLFPESGKKIKKLLGGKIWNILETTSMQEAIQFAYKYTEKWQKCLLSTASPSYSLWKNFEAKWNEFKKEIIQYNFANFKTKKKQIQILEERILWSKLVDKKLLRDIKKLYNNNPYHNYLHVLIVACYCLELSLNDFSLLEIQSMLIASLFHDAGHTGKMELLDEFISLDHFRVVMDKYPNYILNDSICRNFIIGTVFKNRSINKNKYAQIGADIDIGSIWDGIWEFLYYSSLYALELWVTAKIFYTEIEKWYFKFLLWINKNVIITEQVRKILPNSIATIKDFYSIDDEKKMDMFEILRTQDITVDEFKEILKNS